ncbi:MAG TPA: hypothetical protein VK177_10035 [Flavobacteriales bacterium]|nr:hypothetical protein [Flavobacteriales bacterium]
MKNLLIAGFCATLIIPALTGCGGEEKTQVTVNTDTIPKDTSGQLQEEIFYQIPTPNELFGIIKQIGGKGNQGILHKVEDGSKYSDARQKALNFGIYSADLAYASSYDFGTLNLDYLNLIKKMGDEMDISGAFDKTVFDQAAKNIDNNDSIMKISNGLYFKAYSFLEENERGTTLGNIVTGAWIESLYLITSVAGPYKENDPVIQRIAEQKYNYENLWGFLMKYESDEGIKQTISELEELGMIFDSLEMKDGGEAKVEEKDGKNVIVGGSDIVITKAQYNDLVKKIKELRTRMITVNA